MVKPRDTAGAWRSSSGAPLAGSTRRIHGLLPVAQAFREVIARAIDQNAKPSEEGAGTGPLRLEEIPVQVTTLIREHIQGVLRKDAGFRARLSHLAVALCNRGLAEQIAGTALRLTTVIEPQQHRVLTAAEAAGNLQEAIARIEAGGRAAPVAHDRGVLRNPVVALLAGLAERAKSEDALLDSIELDTLVDDAYDYVRRRAALQEQAERRSAYVQRGWSNNSRQRRMEKALKGEIPTALELGALDAELSDAFEVLQTDVETFLEGGDRPVTRGLKALVDMDHAIKESIRLGSPLLRAQLGDPQQSPVLVDFQKVLERVRRIEPGQTPRLETLDDLIVELKRVANRAPVFVMTPEVDSSLALCRTADLPPADVVGMCPAPGNLLPIAGYLDPTVWNPRPASNGESSP